MSKTAQQEGSPLVHGKNIDLPVGPGRTTEPRSVGVQGVRRQLPGPDHGRRKLLAERAGLESELFPAGGQAFRQFVTGKGIDPRDLKTDEQWAPLLEEFAAQPIHGHRRTAQGGNHRANGKDLR